MGGGRECLLKQLASQETDRLVNQRQGNTIRVKKGLYHLNINSLSPVTTTLLSTTFFPDSDLLKYE